jgi:hypothetical protein
MDIVIWNLFGQILRSGGACNLLFPVYPGLGPYEVFMCILRQRNWDIFAVFK